MNADMNGCAYARPLYSDSVCMHILLLSNGRHNSRMVVAPFAAPEHIDAGEVIRDSADSAVEYALRRQVTANR